MTEGAWRLVADKELWEGLFNRSNALHLQQTWEWAKYKERSGDKLKRFVFIDRTLGPTAGFLLCEKFKIKNIMTIANCPGGIFSVPGGPTKISLRCIQGLIKTPLLYLRTDSPIAFEGTPHPVSKRISAPQKLNLILNPNLNVQLSMLSKNWRHNLRRAQKRGLDIREGIPPLDVIISLHQEHGRIKGYGYHFSASELTSLIEIFRDRILGLTVFEGSRPIAYRLVVIYGQQAFDFLAASNQLARSNYCNYLLQWEIVERLISLGIHNYDLGGGDRIKNTSVFNFKSSLGAEVIDRPDEVFFLGLSIAWKKEKDHKNYNLNTSSLNKEDPFEVKREVT